MYHEVLDDEQNVDSWLVVKRSEFIRQMQFLKSNFEILALRDALVYMKKNPVENCKRIAVVTFDDGYSGNFTAALPVMRDLSIPFTIFCATAAIESQTLFWYDQIIRAVLSNDDNQSIELTRLGKFHFKRGRKGQRKWDEAERALTRLKSLPRQDRLRAVEDVIGRLGSHEIDYPVRPLSIRELRDIAECGLAEIGSHTHSHDILVQLPADEVKNNILISLDKLKNWTGRDIRCFSYPNGDHNSEMRNVIREMGFDCAFTTEERKWQKSADLFSLPRLGIGRFDSISQFKFKLSRVN